MSKEVGASDYTSKREIQTPCYIPDPIFALGAVCGNLPLQESGPRAIGSQLRKATMIGAALTNFAAGLAEMSAQAGGKGRVAEQRVTVYDQARPISKLPSLEVLTNGFSLSV